MITLTASCACLFMLCFVCFTIFRSYIARYAPLKKINILKKSYKNFKDINLNSFLNIFVMKKYLLLIFAMSIAATVNSQFLVDSLGNIGIKAGDSIVKSTVSINSAGDNTYDFYLQSDRANGMYINNTNRTYNRYILYFRPDIFPPEDRALLDFATASNAASNVMIFSGKEREQLFDLLACVKKTLETDDTYSRAEAIHTTASIFLMLCRHRENVEEQPKAAIPQFIQTVKGYIDTNAPAIASITELSAKFFYSREYITRVFKQHYRMPIYEYISRRKIFYSCEFLKQGATIKNAAQAAGYHNLSAYNKLFKKIVGMTPSEFKQRESKKA